MLALFPLFGGLTMQLCWFDSLQTISFLFFSKTLLKPFVSEGLCFLPFFLSMVSCCSYPAAGLFFYSLSPLPLHLCILLLPSFGRSQLFLFDKSSVRGPPPVPRPLCFLFGRLSPSYSPLPMFFFLVPISFGIQGLVTLSAVLSCLEPFFFFFFPLSFSSPDELGIYSWHDLPSPFSSLDRTFCPQVFSKSFNILVSILFVIRFQFLCSHTSYNAFLVRFYLVFLFDEVTLPQRDFL